MMTPARKEPDKSTYVGRLAIRLRELREKAGLTQAQAAEALGITMDNIFRWERGTSFPHVAKLEDVAKLYKVKSPRYLFPEK